MSILNALSVFAGGAAQGYRAREETNRQIAEVKRKALLEEREQQIREQAQKTQDALAQQQITESQTNVEGKKKELERRAKPFTGNLGLGNLGERLGIPDLNYGDIADQSSIIDAMLRAQSQQNELNLRSSHPEFFGGSHKPYLSAEGEAALNVLDRMIAANKPSDLILATNKEARDAWEATQKKLFKQYAPDELLQLFHLNTPPVPFTNTPQNRSLMRQDALTGGGKKVMPSARGR